MTPEQPKKQGMSTGAIIAIIAAVCVGGCCIIGILAAIAIPNFIKFQSRSKQVECKVRLKGAFTAEKAWFAEKDAFSTDPKEIGLYDDSTRSVLLLSSDGAPIGKGPNAAGLAEAINTRVPAGIGVSGKCPNCTMTIGCALNADNDPEIDVWSISTEPRTGSRGQPIPAGTPYNDFSDITDSPGE